MRDVSESKILSPLKACKLEDEQWRKWSKSCVAERRICARVPDALEEPAQDANQGLAAVGKV